MGLNQVQMQTPTYAHPQRIQPEKKSDLDKILEGLQVAHQAMGIGVDFTTIKNHMADSDAKEDYNNGILSKGQLLDAQIKGARPAQPGEAGAMPYKVRTGPNDEDVVDSPLVMATSDKFGPVHTLAVGDSVGPGGKHGTTMFAFGEDGTPKNVGFQETAKPEKPSKDPTPKFDLKPDTTGKMWRINTITGDATPVDAGGATFGKPGAIAGTPDPKQVTAERKEISDLMLKGGARSNIGLQQRKVMGAESLETLLANHPDGEIPPQFQTELAMGLANLVSPNGGVTQGEINKMDPQTLGTYTAELAQKLTGKPYSAGNPEFVKLFAETIAREKGAAQDQVGKMVAQAQAAAPNFYKADPKGFHQLTGTKLEDFNTDGGGFAYNPKTLGKKGDMPVGKGDGGTAIAAPHFAPTKSGYSYVPGTVLDIKGQQFTVGEDGDELIPVGKK